MKESLDQLFTLCKKSIELDAWMQETGVNGYCAEIRKEADEVLEALEKNDTENLKEELGDTLMDLLDACILAEKEGLFKAQDVVHSAIEKIRRRRPYIAENRKVSATESVQLWMKAKEKEKLKK